MSQAGRGKDGQAVPRIHNMQALSKSILQFDSHNSVRRSCSADSSRAKSLNKSFDSSSFKATFLSPPEKREQFNQRSVSPNAKDHVKGLLPKMYGPNPSITSERKKYIAPEKTDKEINLEYVTSHYKSPRRAYLEAKINREMLNTGTGSHLAAYSTGTGAIDYQSIAQTFKEMEQAPSDKAKEEVINANRRGNTSSFDASALAREIYTDIGTKRAAKEELVRRTAEEIHMGPDSKTGDEKAPMIQTEKMADIIRKGVGSVGARNDNDLYRAINEAGGRDANGSSKGLVDASTVLRNLGVVGDREEIRSGEIGYGRDGVGAEVLHSPFIPTYRTRRSDEETYGMYYNTSPYARTTGKENEPGKGESGRFVNNFQETASTIKNRFFNLDPSKCPPNTKNTSTILEQIHMDSDPNNTNYKREITQAQTTRTVSPYSRFKGTARDSVFDIFAPSSGSSTRQAPRALSAAGRTGSRDSEISKAFRTADYDEVRREISQSIHPGKRIYAGGHSGDASVTGPSPTLSTFCGNPNAVLSSKETLLRTSSPNARRRNDSTVGNILSGSCPLTYTNAGIFPVGSSICIGNPLFDKM